MNTRAARLAFNRGLVSRLGVARADIHRVALAAETQINWVTRVLGSMSIRPGLEFLGDTFIDGAARFLSFVFSITAKALVELTAAHMRIWIDDALVTRPSVSTAITNGTFAVDLTGWTDNDEAGAVSQQAVGFSPFPGVMSLAGAGTAAAIRTQQVSVAVADRNVEHALAIVIHFGKVTLRVGSTSGADDYITETELDVGYHSLAFTPTGNFYIQFSNRGELDGMVDSVAVDGSGVMALTAPWTASDLDNITYDQSGDIIFVACDGLQQRKIERRATRSWSVSNYAPEDGPFRTENVGPITLTPSGISSFITLTASAPLFRSTHVGALFRIRSIGQLVTKSISAQNTFSTAITVTDVGETRRFTVQITGVWVATVTLQRSFDDGSTWSDVTTYTTNQATTYLDGLDNQTVQYRIGVKTGDFTSGTAAVTLSYSLGSITGVVRVVAFTSSTVVSAGVIKTLGGTDATDVWSEGAWSDFRGWPTAVSFHDGRLTWSGRDQIWMSVSDSFYSFDDDTVGDSGPIARTIGSGLVDTINWSLSLTRLILGGQGSEFSARSSSLDEPITPTNFSIKPASTQGSARVPAVKIDQNGIFVQRGGSRVYELAFGQTGIDYESTDLSALIPDIGSPGIVRIAVQRQPDTRVHFVRSDGTVALLVFDKVENVICWSEIVTDGDIEDAVVLPGNSGDEEDWVYYVVNRSTGGATVRYLEKWAFDSECRPDEDGSLPVCKLADSFVSYNQSPSTTISGLTNLANREVVVWDNGKCLTDADGDIATFTVDNATNSILAVTNGGVSYLATTGVVGLAYSASFKSARLVEIMATPNGSFGDTQIIRGLSLLLADVHAQGLKFGKDLFTATMNDLPRVGDDGGPVDPDELRPSYTTDTLAFPGDYSKDARICLLAQAPRPCTVLAAIADLEHHG
jgi:hypothetical protein